MYSMEWCNEMLTYCGLGKRFSKRLIACIATQRDECFLWRTTQESSCFKLCRRDIVAFTEDECIFCPMPDKNNVRVKGLLFLPNVFQFLDSTNFVMPYGLIITE